MTYKDAFYRALATFVIGASAAIPAAAIMNVETLKVAGIAGIFATWNLIVRWSQAFLDSHPHQG
jgi:hypothetical protein